jgi:hypothetical protein
MRTRGNSGVIGQTVKPGTGGVAGATDAAQASAGGSWPGSVSTNIIYSGGASSGYAVTTTVTSVIVTDSGFANTPGALIRYSNSFIKVFGAGFIGNTVVVVNANNVPQANITYVSQSELRVVLPPIANIVSVTINVLNPSDNSNVTNQASYPISYLVVGGGGSGGKSVGGGGGAGAVANGNTYLIQGISYPIVVGGGGNRVAYPPTAGQRGCAGGPTIFGALFNVAGGGGGGSGGPTIGPGLPSSASAGGGASLDSSNQPAFGGCGTPGQGFPGGKSRYTNCGGTSPVYGGGGGGGFTSAGKDAGACSSVGGAGGNGITWSFTGLQYAGGGGGGRFCSGGGGAGGFRGGSGGSRSGGGQAGAVGSGSGGGGGGSTVCLCCRASGGGGGSGTVILVIPNAIYPTVSAPGASVSTPPNAPGRTVLTYTTPGCAPCRYTPRSFTFIA